MAIYIRCALVELLNYYDVKLSGTLQAKLDSHLCISARGTDNLQQVPCQPNGQVEQLVLDLKKPTALKILIDIGEDLQSFLKPILEQLEFLVYFHLHKCKIFIRHLNNRIAEASANSEQPSAVPATAVGLPVVSTIESSDTNLLQVIAIDCSYMCSSITLMYVTFNSYLLLYKELENLFSV